VVTLLAALLLTPLTGAFLSTPTRGRDSDTLAILTSSATVVLAITAILARSPAKMELPLYGIPWLPDSGRIFGFFLDPLSAMMVIIISVIGFLVILYSTAYLSPRNLDHASGEGKGRYFLWMFLFLGSMLGLVLSPNFLQMFIFWELTSVCSWALISFYGGEKPLAAGFKALLLTNLGGIGFMVAIVILYVSTHSFAFEAVQRLEPQTRVVVFLLFLLAAWAKAAQIPFYTWLPDAMEAPTPVSAYLHAAAMVKAGVYLIARIVITPAGLPWWVGLVVAGPAVLTMVIACLLFFFQDDLKKLLAYSTITHLSYILLGCGLGILGSATGMIGGILHIINHAFAKALLFLSVGVIAYATGVKSIRELSGLSHRMPLVSLAFFVGILGVTGVPPFSTFWSKFFLLTGAVDVGGNIGLLILIPFVLEVIVAFAWFLRVGQKVFFGEVSAAAAPAQDPSFAMSAVLVILMIFSVLAPFIGLPLVHQIQH
jgi:hydrogenase-4 component D